MAWTKATGYKRGRPRKGEIRPETPGGKAAEKWRRENPERAAEINRAGQIKFKEHSYEKTLANARDSYRRLKDWRSTKLSFGNDAIDIHWGSNNDQVINCQIDARLRRR